MVWKPTSQSAFGRSTRGPPRSWKRGKNGTRAYERYCSTPYSLSVRIDPERTSYATKHSFAFLYLANVASCWRRFA